MLTNATCFECGAPAKEVHHVVPVSLGGTRTVTLCQRGHDLAHSRKIREDSHSALVKKGIERARTSGRVWGRKRKHNVPIDEVRSMVARGYSLSKISSSLGIPKSTIFRQLKAYKGDE